MKNLLKKLVFLIGLLSVFSCTNELSSSSENDNNQKFGSVIIKQTDESRALGIEQIKKAKIVVKGSLMNEISVESVVTNGKGEFSVSNIPVGKNRIVLVQALDSADEIIPGFEIGNILDVIAGENTVQCTWKTTGLAKVFDSLLNKGLNISEISDEKKSSIIDVIPDVKSYLVDSENIAADFSNNQLKTKEVYLLKTATLSYVSEQASGYSINVLDPISEKKVIGTETSGTVTGIAPGKWNVEISDGTNVISTKIVEFISNSTTDLGKIVNFAKKMIIFVKASSAPKIWVWQPEGNQKVLGVEYNSRPTMENATIDYMKNPDGWFMIDLTDKTYTEGKTFSFKLNEGGDIVTDKTKTFWYDGTEFFDSDPTINQLSNNANLSSISVNGTKLADFSADKTSYDVSILPAVTKAVISVVLEDSNATYQISPADSSVESGKTVSFTIKVTAQDSTEKNYTVNVKRSVLDDVTLSKLTVNGRTATLSGTDYSIELTGSESSVTVSQIAGIPTDSNASVTYSKSSFTISDGNSEKVTVTVKNGAKSATYSLTVSYKIQEQSEFYWTNKNGAVGTNKTISSFSDWTEAERIAQCAAYDDPRTWRGIQEVPYDVYALYGAYDDTNLYVMVELTNLADGRATFMNHDYAGSDNCHWDNRNIPIGLTINTGSSNVATGSYINADKERVWGGTEKGVAFEDSNGFDWLLYHSSKYGYAEHSGSFVGVGTPGFFHAQADGYFSYYDCLSVNTETTTGTSGIDIRYMRTCAVSKEIYFESTPTGNRAESAQTAESLLTSTTYTAVETNNNDMSYWYTIPLSTLGITKADIETKGIGIRQLTTGGGSLMDCAPWDSSMVDVATEECSDDASTSAEKNDTDTLTTVQARIGHM